MNNGKNKNTPCITANPNDLVSIIIPVYNGERYIKECIDSVLAQTYTNIEVIIINDGSNDNTGSICESYYNNDIRIKYLNKENQGVSEARNTGITASKGKYIMFADADDYMSNNCVESFIDTYNDKFPDLLCCSYDEFTNENTTEHICNNYYEKKDVEENLIDIWPYVMGPWGKLFNSNIIKNYNIKFRNNMPYGEDAVFNLQYISHCENIQVFDRILYHHRIHRGGASNASHYYDNMNKYLYEIYKNIIDISNRSSNIIMAEEISKYFNNIFVGMSIEHYLYHKCRRKDIKIKQTIELFGNTENVYFDGFTTRENLLINRRKYKLFILRWYVRKAVQVAKRFLLNKRNN